MSIEAFIGENKGPTVRAFVDNRKAIEESQGHSKRKLEVLAEAYIGAGADGIKAVTERLNDRGVALRPDAAMFSKLSDDEKDRLGLNVAAVFFGASIVAIEASLINRYFDCEQLAVLVNEPLRPTPYPKWVVLDPVETLSDEKWRAMIALAVEDLSLSVFFEERGFGFLPESLKNPLAQTGLLPIIRERLLPVYRDQAKAVLGI